MSILKEEEETRCCRNDDGGDGVSHNINGHYWYQDNQQGPVDG